MGPFTIDRFADNENAKVPRFNSKFACPSSEACDAFSQKWENEMNLLVPPVREIPKVINHINRGHIRGVLVIPYWTSSVFWPLLVDENGKFLDFITDKMIINGSSCSKEGNCSFFSSLCCLSEGLQIITRKT